MSEPGRGANGPGFVGGQSTVTSRGVSHARNFARTAGFFSIAVGGLALAGWSFDVTILKGILPGLVTMKANTAIGFLLAGAALSLLTFTPRLRQGARLCAGVLALLGGLTLAEYVFHLDLSMDQLLFREPAGTAGTLAPGRMAPATALNFALSGCALILASFRRTPTAAQWLALPVASIGLLAFLGLVYGPIGGFGLGRYLQLALHTDVGFVMLGAGLLLVNPSEGFMKEFMAESPGGWLLRRMAFVVPGVAFLIGWARILGERLGWYEGAVGVALIVTTFVVLMLAAIWWAARSLDHMDCIRSQAEAHGRERAEETRAMLYSIGDGVIAVDAMGRLIHMNPMAERFTGWTEAEALGRPLGEVFHIISEETQQPAEDPVARILKEGQAVGLANHTLLQSRDGTRRAIASSGAPVRDDRGDVTRLVLVFRDQTEERRLARLAQIRTELNEYADTHSLDELLIQMLDEAGRMVDSPIAFYHFYDKDTGKLTLQQWSTGTRTEFGKAEGQGSHHVLDHAGIWVDCVRLRRPIIHNDSAALAHTKGLPPGHAEVARELAVPVLRANRIVAILGVGNKPADYTGKDLDSVAFLAETTWIIIERKCADSALRTSEGRLRRLHESMRDAYAQVDMEGRIVEYNQQYLDMLGYAEGELRQLTYVDLTPPEWHGMEARIIQEEVLPIGYSRVYEKAYRRKDGTVFPVEFRTFLLRSDDGSPVGMWGIARDISERKHMEKALQKSNLELQQIFKNMINGFVIWESVFDEGGRYVSFRFALFNDAFSRIAKLNLEEVRGKDVFEVWPDTEQSWVAMYGGVATTGIPRTFDLYHTPTRGWYHCNAYRPTDSPSQVCVIFEDITERRQMEGKLHETERTARATLDALSQHIAILDGTGTILDVNVAWRRFAQDNPPITGPVSEGANYFEVCVAAKGPDGLTATAFAEGIRSVMEGQRTEYIQEYACHSPEVHRWFVGKVTRFAGEGPLRLVVAHENITERKVAESAMVDALAAADRFRKAMDRLSVLVYIKDRQRRYVYANRPTLELFHCTAEELQGSDDSRFFPPGTVAQLQAVDTRVLEQGEATAEEIFSQTADGRRRTYWEVKAPIFDDSNPGAIWGLCGVSTDITDRKAAEDQIAAAQVEAHRLLEIADKSRQALLSLVEDQKAAEDQIRKLNADLEQRVTDRTVELEAANKELEAFAYSVSHDLRAPLRHMDGFLFLLGRHLGDGLDETGAHFLEVAQRATVRMGQLVDALLSFSRLGRSELHLQEIETDQVLASVIEEFRGEWADRTVRWQLAEMPRLYGDLTLIRLVFQNLVGNALKFTRGQSEAVIEVQPIKGLTGEVGLLIRDNGAGFDPAYLHKLFGVFQRLHREDEFEGTGIGLANVHRIVSRHGGRVWAEGQPGKGATFFVTLPHRENAT